MLSHVKTCRFHYSFPLSTKGVRFYEAERFSIVSLSEWMEIQQSIQQQLTQQ